MKKQTITTVAVTLGYFVAVLTLGGIGHLLWTRRKEQ